MVVLDKAGEPHPCWWRTRLSHGLSLLSLEDLDDWNGGVLSGSKDKKPASRSPLARQSLPAVCLFPRAFCCPQQPWSWSKVERLALWDGVLIPAGAMGCGERELTGWNWEGTLSSKQGCWESQGGSTMN